MGILVKSVKLANEFNELTYSWLRHNRGEKIPIEIKFEVSTSVKIWSSNKLTYNPDSFVQHDWIKTHQNSFGSFYVGDTIKITDATIPSNNGTYTIIEKQDDKTLRLNQVFANAVSLDAVIEVVDVVDKVRFNFNFIENSDPASFLSKVDNNIQQANAIDLDASNTAIFPLFFQGEKSWQIGDLQIKGDGIDTSVVYTSKFIITGNLYLTPFFLADEWNDIIANIQPVYFLNLKALKFIYRIEASYVGRSPQFNQFFQDNTTLGQSGGYNENFDLTDTNYSIYSFQLLNGTDILPAIQLTEDEQDFTIVVKNTVDTPFNASSRFTMNFVIAPQTVAEYKNNGKFLSENFKFDRLIQECGNAAIDGEQFSVLGRQVFKQVSATFDSNDQITITGKISLGANLVTYLRSLDNPRYIIWIGTGQGVTTEIGFEFEDGDSYDFEDDDTKDFEDTAADSKLFQDGTSFEFQNAEEYDFQN